jgi:glycine/D-amino acid oxidase-like deaminating enzyme
MNTSVGMNTSFSQHSAVIGRGIIGLTIALRLREQGVPVVIVSKQQLPGSASHVAIGVSAMRGLLQPKTELFRQKLLGHHLLARLIPELENLTKQKIPHNFSGAYEFFTAKTYGKLRRRVYHRLPTGLFAFKCLNFEQTAAHLAPYSQSWGPEDKKAAFFYPNDGWFDPDSLLAALEARLVQLGVVFVDEIVTRVDVDRSDASLLISCASSVLRVARVVVAAGAGSENLLRSSGIGAHEFSYSSGVTLRTKFRESSKSIAVKNGAESWMCAAGELRCGGENIAASNEYSSEELLAAERKIKDKFTRMTSDVFGGKFTNENSCLSDSAEMRSGVRVRMKGDKPWIGFAPFTANPQAGVWVSCGFYKYGYYVALPAADQLMEMMLGTKTAP